MLANPQGIALDGENLTNNDDPNTGVQLAAPLGQRLSRAATSTTLHHQHHARRSITKGTFQLVPTSDTNIVGDLVTSSRTCRASSGRSPSPIPLSCPWPARPRSSTSASRARRQRQPRDLLRPRHGPAILQPYVRPNAGTGLTDANGNFSSPSESTRRHRTGHQHQPPARLAL